jgi:hypothetical protein
MLVWQSRLNKDYPFEFVIQESSGKGYQKIEHKYKTAYVADTDPSKVFQALFAMKMVEKAEALLKEIDSDITVKVDIPGEVEKKLAETYEEVVTEPERVEVETEAGKVERETFEVEVGGIGYEVEIPDVKVEHVKKAGIFKRLSERKSRKGKKLKEIEAVGELEVDVDVADVSIEYQKGGDKK